MFMGVVLGMMVVVTAGLALMAFAFGEVAFSEKGAVPRTGATGQKLRSTDTLCPSGSNQPIRVSTPETLAIADVVRKTQPASEVERIHGLSSANARRINGLSDEQYAQERIVCPLLSREGGCVAYDVRPLHCRGWCLNSGQNGDRCLLNESGVEDGITQGLRSAGLDGNLYELNGALDVALGTQDAASRWAKGETVLAG